VLESLRRRFTRSSAWRVLTETVVAMIALAVLGAVLGPQWDPVPLNSSLRTTTSSTAISGAPSLPEYEVRETMVTVRLDGATVQGRISEPVDAPPDRPAVVFVHGAGTDTYANAFRAQARALAAAGVVALVPEKRLDTYTTAHRDYVKMAADYARSVQTLRTWPGVDPDRVGVYAESEGGWIAPVMAATDPRLAFVVLVSPPVVPPREQAAFAADSYLRNTGVPAGVFRAIPRAVGLSIPGAFEYVDFDVSSFQQRMRQPVLVAYGTDDASMPLVQGPEQIISDVAKVGNHQVTVRYYADANHGLKVDDQVVEEFLVDLPGWVLGLPQTAMTRPHVAGAQPEQHFRADPVPTPRWLRDGTAVLVWVGSSAAALIAAVALGMAGRGLRALRRRRAPDVPAPEGISRSVSRPLTWCALGSVATVAVLVWYLVAVARLALDYERDPLVVTGGWLAVRVIGLLAVLAGVIALRALVPHGDRVVRPVTGVLPRSAVALAGLGCVGLLVAAAYWGVFQLGI